MVDPTLKTCNINQNSGDLDSFTIEGLNSFRERPLSSRASVQHPYSRSRLRNIQHHMLTSTQTVKHPLKSKAKNQPSRFNQTRNLIKVPMTSFED